MMKNLPNDKDATSPQFKHVHINNMPRIILKGKMTITFEGLEILIGHLESDEQIDNLNKDKRENE